MIEFRKIAVVLIAGAALSAGIAATAPHDWGKGFGAAAAAAAAEGGVCAFLALAAADTADKISDERENTICL